VCAVAAGLSAFGGVTAFAADDPAFDRLTEDARQLAASPYQAPDTALPEAVQGLDYDGHRDIRCLPEDFLWHGTDAPFRVQFRHRGWLFRDKVQLGTVDRQTHEVTALPFDRDRFTYGPIALSELDPAQIPDDLGYPGIALHRVGFETQDDGTEAETFNEFLSIQGGCYFRAIGFGQHWGSSARAVAINTGLPEPEEFPSWTKLWVQRPAPGSQSVTLYGLLDGPSVSGAYRFEVTPGTTTSMQITGRLFFRQSVDKLGLAPITGMFLFGEEMPARFGDYRPEVHDADGLLMQHADGELDWRPLRNPHQTRVSRFSMTDPQGFGLIQRDRNFNHYEDLETEMQIRPSIWVEPQGDWGEGWVELFEIASDDEGIDNIGAYWVPAEEKQLSAGDELELSYRIEFTQEPRPAARSVMPWAATRTMFGQGGDEEANAKSLVRTAVGEEAAGRPVARFILDTAPGSALPSGTIVRHDVSVTHGQIAGEPVIQYNPFNHAYRLFFDVIATGDEPVELRATLRGATALDREKEAHPEKNYDDVVDPDTGPPLSETWLYRWDPQ
jgi:glucans biosynthesis protein